MPNRISAGVWDTGHSFGTDVNVEGQVTATGNVTASGSLVSPALQVSGTSVTTLSRGVNPFALYPFTPVGNGFTASVPGFYFVSGSTFCTGTIPAASSQPGAVYMFMLTNAQPMRLTCSLRSPGSQANFAHNDAYGLLSSSAGGTTPTARDDGLNLVQSGSVSVQSNGQVWQPLLASGSITLAPAGAPGL